MIKIIIHRGTHQIGGCATEIECNGERVLIDLGSNLPGTNDSAPISDNELLDKVFGKKRDRHFDAILFSHYHGDHIGLYKNIPPDHKMFIGPVAKEIMKVLASYVDRNAEIKGGNIIEAMNVYSMGQPIDGFKEMVITPLFVDHSALDAYMFLIEAEGKKILFTGDFREHGIANEKEQLWRTIDKYVGSKVDVLFTEGTMLSRLEETAKNPIITEDDLGKKAAQYFTDKKYNFVLVSSTNLDSIMEFYHNTPEDKMFVCDAYQAKVIMTAVIGMYKNYSKYQGKREYKSRTKMIYIHGKISMEDYSWLNDSATKIKEAHHAPIYFKLEKASKKDLKDGFVMLVRPNRFLEINGESEFERLVSAFRKDYPDETQFIYSMWDGYLSGKAADENIIRITGGKKAVEVLHTSGHAYVETIAKLMHMVNPDVVIPMHTEVAEKFIEFKEFESWKDKVHELVDGENYIM